MTTMKEMTHKKVLIEKRTKPDFASAMAEITAVADAGFIAELTALEPEKLPEYHFGISFQEAWEIGIYRWEEAEEVDSMDAVSYAYNAGSWTKKESPSSWEQFADKPQHYINKDVMDALRASAPKFEENEMSIVTTADYFGKPVGIESPEVPEPAQDTDGPDEAAKPEGVISRLTKKIWGKPKGEDKAQNAYAEALANSNAEEAEQEAPEETIRPKPASVFDGSDNIEVYIECPNCDNVQYRACYKTNNYLKCPNCKEKLHIQKSTEHERNQLDIEHIARRKFLSSKERYEYKQGKGLI